MLRSIPLIAMFVSLVTGMMVLVDGARAESYVLDSKHTEVRFAYTLGLSVQRGRFTSVQGVIEFDAEAPEKTRVDAVIQTASLTADVAIIERALKGRDFFDTERQPEIRFQSDSVNVMGADAAQMTGAITVNGITQPITLDVSITPDGDSRMKNRTGARRFSAVGQIRRSAFNMTGYSLIVADDISIEIEALLKKKRSDRVTE